MYNFGIVGYGVVGKATHKSLIKNNNVVIHDVSKDTDLDSLLICNYTFICTPSNTDSDIDDIIKIAKYLTSRNKRNQIIIRSTMPIGSCKRIEEKCNISIIYMPEFLRERHWQTDCHRRPLVVGYNKANIPEWLKKEQILECSLEEAELLKMFNNALGAMRVTFANHFYELAQKVGGDYGKVLNMHLSTRHNQTYLQVPGPDGNRGFSGKCLPKDLDFLIRSMEQLELEQNLFSAIKNDNDRLLK